MFLGGFLVFLPERKGVCLRCNWLGLLLQLAGSHTMKLRYHFLPKAY